MTKQIKQTKSIFDNHVRVAVAAFGALAAITVQTPQAEAVGLRVKLACRSDYYAHCSQHGVDTPGLRQCMRAVGSGLSPNCINALVAAGEVSKDEVEKKSAKLR